MFVAWFDSDPGVIRRPMKTLPLTLLSVAVWTSQPLSAASLMLDFGPTAVASPYLSLSPGHVLGNLTGSDTTWNTISTSSSVTNLKYSNGTDTSGITLVLGQESSVGNGSISYSTTIGNIALPGTGGGTSGRKSLLTTGSIYGDDTNSTAAGRDGFFGGGTAAAGAAIGLRLDGLAAGDYTVYVMGRNTSSNDTGSRAMTFYTTTGASSGTFAFGSATSGSQVNTTYTNAAYTNQFNSFVAGENYVAFNISLATGESLFLATDGTGLETRGFLNMVQIVSVPESSALLLGFVGLLPLFRRRR